MVWIRRLTVKSIANGQWVRLTCVRDLLNSFDYLFAMCSIELRLNIYFEDIEIITN